VPRQQLAEEGARHRQRVGSLPPGDLCASSRRAVPRQYRTCCVGCATKWHMSNCSQQPSAQWSRLKFVDLNSSQMSWRNVQEDLDNPILVRASSAMLPSLIQRH